MPSLITAQFAQFMDNISNGGGRMGRDCERLVALIVIVTMLSVTPIGYHIIALNVPANIIQRDIVEEFRHKYGMELSDNGLNVIWSFVVSCQSIGALIGCIFVLPMERNFGTKRSLLLVNNLLLVAASLSFMAISQHTNVFFLLTLGRLLVGMYTGIGCALVPIYIQELAPTQLKGALCCFVHIAICAGSALGTFLSLDGLLGGASTWTILLSVPLLLALAQIFLGLFLQETPNFFLRKSDEMSAADSIKFHYSLPNNLDTHTTIREYHHLVSKLPPQCSVGAAFRNRHVRERICLGMACSVAQIFSGSMAAVSYSTSMLQSVSFTAWLTPFIPTLGALLSILLTLPALSFVETCGRKHLLVNTLGICAAANFLLVLFSLLSQIFDHHQPLQSLTSFAFLLCFFVYGIGYNVGVGPVAYFLPAELVPANAVSVAMGAATALNWFSSMLSTIIYYPLNGLIGGWSFLVFAIPTTFFAVYFHQKLPNDIDDDEQQPSQQIATPRNGSAAGNDGTTWRTSFVSGGRTPANTMTTTATTNDDDLDGGNSSDMFASADDERTSDIVGTGAGGFREKIPRLPARLPAQEQTPLSVAMGGGSSPPIGAAARGGGGRDRTRTTTTIGSTGWYSTFGNNNNL